MKTPIPIFTGNIVNGKLKLSGVNKDRMNLWLSSFCTGTEVDITIKKHSNKRTLPQNNYYFGVVLVILADYFGHDTTEAMHDDMKLLHNPIKSKVDPTKTIGGSTAKMTTEEFFSNETSFVNRVRRWASIEYGINTPDPKKVE